jgi:putative transposase
MKIVSNVIPGSIRLGKRTADISREAQLRVKWFDYYFSHGNNAQLTCRHFGISRQTFYRWKRRYNPQKLTTLESLSCRPRNTRQPTWSTELTAAVLKLREENPRWGKDKLADLLQDEGYRVSVSMVGRIIRRLKDTGILVEPLITHVSTGKRLRKRPYAIRKPKDHKVSKAGDLVQLDTLDIRPLPGIVLKHFTAHDILSKWNVINVFSRATATNAASFLDMIEQRMPFPVKAIQVDGGSEFEAIFEEKCRQRGIKLFVLPPRSPKLNGGVERAHRTHTEEFYEITDSDFSINDLRPKLFQWELRYNTVRPHQSLHYLTPYEFLQQHNKIKEVKCH